MRAWCRLNRVSWLAVLGLMFGLLFAPGAQAYTAYDHASTGGDQSWTGSLGMDFQVGATSVIITDLGYFDPSGVAIP